MDEIEQKKEQTLKYLDEMRAATSADEVTYLAVKAAIELVECAKILNKKFDTDNTQESNNGKED